MTTFDRPSLRDTYNTLMAHIARRVRYSSATDVSHLHAIAAQMRPLLRLTVPADPDAAPALDLLGDAAGSRPGYVPEVFSDEASPPVRPHPNDWLRVRGCGQRWLIADEIDDGTGGCTEAAEWPGEYGPLADGMIIRFAVLTTYPNAVLEVWHDTDDTLAHRWISAPHPDARLLQFDYDWESMSAAAEFLADAINNDALEPGTHTVCALTWDSADFVFVGETNSFRPVTAADAA